MNENTKQRFVTRPLTPTDFPAMYDLRSRVLRPDLPPGASVFPGDERPDTVHLGAFDHETGRLAGIATLVRNDGFQLRGMATEEDFRGTGAGAAVLAAVHAVAEKENLPLWCNARRAAAGFYARHGWETEGEEFDIAGVGPHYKMRWR